MIFGTKNRMHKNTTGHAIIKRSNHDTKKLLFNPTLSKIINKDTNVLVQKDIKKANI